MTEKSNTKKNCKGWTCIFGLKEELKMLSPSKFIDPSPGVKKDPSKTFYFRDVLKLHFKRTLINTCACGKEEKHNNHQHMKT